MYDADTFSRLHSFRFTSLRNEGWGITHDGSFCGGGWGGAWASHVGVRFGNGLGWSWGITHDGAVWQWAEVRLTIG